MDDYGSDTKWLWVLGIVVLIVAVVGLVFAISAKNNSVDEDKVTSQISEELEAAGVAVEGEKAASDKASRLAAADRLQIKRAVRAERKEAERRIDNLAAANRKAAAANKKVADENAELKSDVTRLEDDYSQLFEKQERTEADLEALEKRVRRLAG
jgi:cytochrome c-type biogenesis protein CcmH/NrfF